MYRRKIEKSDQCLNCRTELNEENFCPNCGQLNNQRKPRFAELMGEMVSNVFAFDSKFYRTIGPLLFKPGFLTQEYTAGRKGNFMLPLRLFIVTTILLLFINSIGTDNLSSSKKKAETEESNSTMKTNLDFGDAKRLEKMWVLIHAQDTLSQAQVIEMSGFKSNLLTEAMYFEILKIKKADRVDFGRYLKSKTLFILLAFIPVLALLLRVFYVNQPKFFYIDHFIFGMHQQTTLILLLSLYSLLSLIGIVSGAWFLLVYVLFAIHLFKALKNFYQEKTWLTLVKFILINITFFFVTIIFLILSIVITFLLY